MRPQLQDDPILRESRRATLARRLISHGVRTEMIGRLTGLTRSRLATLRRRLMVADETRLRGPAPSLRTHPWRSAQVPGAASRRPPSGAGAAWRGDCA